MPTLCALVCSLVVFVLIANFCDSFEKPPSEEERFLRRIMLHREKSDAKAAFQSKKATVFTANSGIINIQSFSEQRLAGEAFVLVQMAWKDPLLSTWDPRQLFGRSILYFRRPHYFWRPPADVDVGRRYPHQNELIALRNDSFVVSSFEFMTDFYCATIPGSRYPHERINCTTFTQPRVELMNINYVCKLAFNTIFESNEVFSGDDDCVNHSSDRVQLLNYGRDWRVESADTQGAFVLERKRNHLFTADVLSCTSTGVLVLTQFAVQINYRQRILIALFATLVAAQNLDAISLLELVVSSRASPRLTTFSVALFGLQLITLCWHLLAARLTEQPQPPPRVLEVSRKRLTVAFDRITGRYRPPEFEGIVEIQEMEENEQGEIREVHAPKRRFSWEDVARTGDCFLGGVVLLILFFFFLALF